MSFGSEGKVWARVGILLAGVLFAVGCSKKAAPPPPAAKQSNQGVTPAGASATDGDKPGTDGSSSGRLSIKLSGKTGTKVDGKEGSSLNVKFEISGVSDADDVQIAFLDAPDSVKLTGRDSLKPIITWSSPKSGTHRVRFVLRDIKACQSKKSPSECELSTADDRKVSTGTYDIKSETYTLDIERKSSSAGGADGGANNNGGGGGNNELIGKIIGIAGGLLGGGGGGLGGLGGGGGGLGGLQNILGGLGGGQLNGLLGALQGGGGGAGGLGNFNQLLNQFTGGGGGGGGGFPLTGDPAADLEGIIRNYEERAAEEDDFNEADYYRFEVEED